MVNTLWRCIFGICFFVLFASGNSVPERYGAAYEREDTTRGSFTVNVSDSTRPLSSEQLWNMALSTSRIPLGNTMLSVKTGLYNYLMSPFSPMMQQVALSRTFQNTVLQLGAGYQPVRKNEMHQFELMHDEEVYGVSTIVDVMNSDRFTGRLNGITDIDSVRHIIYGAEYERKMNSGMYFDRSIDFEDKIDDVYYSEYSNGDGYQSFTVGAGYWRNFLRHGKQYKCFWLIEGFLNREKKALRYDPSILTYLKNLQEQIHSYNNDYYINTTGMFKQQSGVSVQYTLSNRFLPMVPVPYQGDDNRLICSQGIEHLNATLAYALNYQTYGSITQRDASAYRIQGSTDYNIFDSYTITTNYAWRLFVNVPWSTPGVAHYLTGRVTCQSESELQSHYHYQYGRSNVNAAVWTGLCSRLFKRFLLEVAYQPVITDVRLMGYKGKNREARMDLEYVVGGHGGWLLQMQLLY